MRENRLISSLRNTLYLLLCLLVALSIATTPSYAQGTSEFETTIKAAEQGNAIAQFNLGNMFKSGEGVAQDDKQAVAWYTKAAEQGQSRAQFNLALMYANGLGVDQDYKQTVYWFTKSAEQGQDRAPFNLGQMYSTGKGVPKDLIQAYAWYSLGATSGDNDSVNSRDLVAKKLSPKELGEAKTLAAQYSKKVDENNNESSARKVSAADIPDTLGNRLAAAQRYLDAVSMEAMMLDVATESAKNFPEDARPSYIQYMTKTIRLNVIEGAALTAMTQHFTVKELNALAEFYGSPEGRSAMKKFGAYMADITPTVLQELQRAQKQLESQLAKDR